MAITPQGVAAGTAVEVETSTRALRQVPHAPDWQVYGSYCHTINTGAASISASQTNASIWQLRTFGPTPLNHALAVRKIVLSPSGPGSGQGGLSIILFQLFVVRNATASGSGGTAATFTGNNGKLRTSMNPSLTSDLRYATASGLTPMTGAQDAMPVASMTLSDFSGSLPSGPPYVPMFEARAGEYPLLLVANEGLNLQLTLPAMSFSAGVSITVAFDELVAY